MTANRIEHRPADQRLGNDVIESGFVRSPYKAIVVKARNHNRGAVPALRAQLLQHRKTVYVGHAIVQDHTMRIERLRVRQEGSSRRIAAHLIPVRPQQQVKRASHGRIVVGQEDPVLAV